MVTDLNKYTWEEIAAMDPAEMTYILPISSLEQHGRHLALGADDFILRSGHKANLFAACVDCVFPLHPLFVPPMRAFGIFPAWPCRRGCAFPDGVYPIFSRPLHTAMG